MPVSIYLSIYFMRVCERIIIYALCSYLLKYNLTSHIWSLIETDIHHRDKKRKKKQNKTKTKQRNCYSTTDYCMFHYLFFFVLFILKITTYVLCMSISSIVFLLSFSLSNSDKRSQAECHPNICKYIGLWQTSL